MRRFVLAKWARRRLVLTLWRDRRPNGNWLIAAEICTEIH